MLLVEMIALKITFGESLMSDREICTNVEEWKPICVACEYVKRPCTEIMLPRA